MEDSIWPLGRRQGAPPLDGVLQQQYRWRTLTDTRAAPGSTAPRWRTNNIGGAR